MRPMSVISIILGSISVPILLLTEEMILLLSIYYLFILREMRSICIPLYQARDTEQKDIDFCISSDSRNIIADFRSQVKYNHDVCDKLYSLRSKMN